jgi:hypothetical protein
VAGVPAKVRLPVTNEEDAGIGLVAEHCVGLARQHAAAGEPVSGS